MGCIAGVSKESTAVQSCWTWVKRAFILPIRYAIYLLAAAFIFAIILSFFNLISKRTKAEKTSTNNVFIPGLAITQIALTLLNALGLIIFVVINNPKTGSVFYFLLIIPILLLLFGGLLINNFIKKSSNRKNKPLYIIQIVTISIMVLIISLLMRNLPLEHQIFNAIIWYYKLCI
ncbi:hypothetical protein [Pasteurella multocida]|uniref:hypothetical protein n=1 Tax=Pasteurella multocida TaxID=747 RepID=UPI0031844DD1